MVSCYYLVKLWMFCMPFISFFGTNLLTQCQVPVPVFLCVFGSFQIWFWNGVQMEEKPQNDFSWMEEDQGAFGPRQVGSREPTSPHSPTRGRRRWAGLWPPWPPPNLSLWPINSQIFRKKSGEPRKYFSTTASFRFREISSGEIGRASCRERVFRAV